MVDPDHVALSITRQCRLVSIARSSFYYEGTGESPLNLQLLRRIDEQFLETPFYGSRQMTRWLRRQGPRVSRKRVRRLMRLLGLQAIFQRPRTSEPHPEHRIYPYLLRDLAITRPNHVWCSDVTYIPLTRGFLYLVAVMDWASRKVLAWRLSNTRESSFCVEALRRGARTRRAPRDLQHRPGEPIYKPGPSPTGSRTLGSTSRWTARAAGWITSSSSGCGARSNMSRSTWRSMPRAPTPAPASAGGSSSTTSGDRTRRSGTERPDEAYNVGAAPRPGLCPTSSQPEAADL